MKSYSNFGARFGAAAIAVLTISSAFANGVIHRVHVGGPDACEASGFDGPGCDANFSLNALMFSNGRVTGNYTDRFANGDGFHAQIDCLFVDGTDAWVSGWITKGRMGDTDLAGSPVATRVRDNGTSANDVADQISFSWIGDDTSCLVAVPYQLLDMPDGQVVVE
jgi:hypothetical protein